MRIIQDIRNLFSNKSVVRAALGALSTLSALAIVLATYADPASAAGNGAIAGTWTGSYVCSGIEATLVLELDAEAGGTFIFAYPDGNAGRYTISTSFTPAKGVVKARPVQAIQMPSGYSMVGFSGVLSKDGGSITGRVRSCGKFRVARGTKAPEGGLAAAAKGAATSDRVRPRSDETGKNGAKTANGELPQGAFQDLDARCQTGRMVVRVDFGAPDKDGFDTTISLRRKRFASFTQFRGRAEQDGRKIVVHAETKAHGPYQGIEFDLVLNRGTRPGGPFKAVSDELQCYGIYLRPTEEAGPGEQPPPPVPAKYQPFVGSYDGAVYGGDFMGAIVQNIDQRVTSIIPLSLEISPSHAGGTGRIFDVTLWLNGWRYSYALVEDTAIARKGLALVPAEEEEPYPKKGPVPYTTSSARHVDALPKGGLLVFADGGATNWIGTGRLYNSEVTRGGVIALKRRATEQKKSLASICDDDLKPLIASMGIARNKARELKIGFYPALNTLDTGKAATIEAALAAKARELAGTFDIAKLAFECSLTGSRVFTASAGTLSEDLFPPTLMSEALHEVTGWYSDGAVAVTYPDTVKMPGDLEAANSRAEVNLDALVRAAEPLRTTADILAEVERKASEIGDARPSAMSEKLAPLLARLAEVGSEEQKARSVQKRDAARQRMAGIPTPYDSIGPSRTPLLNAITSGETRNLTGDDKLFLSGMLTYSSEKCGQPAPAVRMRLLGILLQGTQLLTGLDFNQQGGFGEALGRSLQRQKSFADGTAAAQSIGCGSDYIPAMFELLASGSIDTVRPSLLVRSCALDRPPGQCECIQGVAKQVFPGVAETRFSRSVIEQTITTAPGIGLQFATLCGVVNY